MQLWIISTFTQRKELKMLKHAKIVENNLVSIFVGTDINWAIRQGFSQMDVEQGYDGNWYLSGTAPQKPEAGYIDKRLAEYPPIGEQLDMIYHDYENWKSTIAQIKAKYPKP